MDDRTDAAVRRATPRAPHTPPSTVTLICGCMFSGKTTELLRGVANHAPSRTLAVKHAMDTRYGATHIVSHAGKACPARIVSEARQIVTLLPKHTELVVLDEAHFFDPALRDVARALVDDGISVIMTALDLDSWGRPFPLVQRLYAAADEPITMYATCARCGVRADRTQRRTPIIDGHMVGGPESYEPRCRTCWRPPPEPSPR